MQRPIGVAVATFVMGTSLLAEILLVLDLPASRAPYPKSADALLTGTVITMVAFILIAFWYGMNWARWLVMVESVFCILRAGELGRTWLRAGELGRIRPYWQFLGALIVFNAALGLYLLVYLNTSNVVAWFVSKSRRPTQSEQNSSETPQS